MYAESSLRKENDTASLISPVFSPEMSEAACLKVAVYMVGADMGSLLVGQFPEGAPSEREVLGQLSGNHEDQWEIFLVDLRPSHNQTFQLVLQATLGRSYLSDLGLDAVELLAGEDCHHLRASYRPPRPWQGEELLSPGSCQGRCGQNISQLGVDWEEGGCDCQDSSSPLLACPDFPVLCGPEDTTETKTGRLWGDTLAWTTPMVVVIVSSALLLLLLVTIRLRTVKHHGDGEEDSEEADRIIEDDEEEEEEEVVAAVNKRTTDVEEFIDFTLATACELDTVNNTQRYETIMSLSNRKITTL